FVLTDEAFAMATGYSRRGGRRVRYYATFAVALYIVWIIATIVGVLLGDALGEPRRFGVDFAITATFLAIVVLGFRRRSAALVAPAVVAPGGTLTHGAEPLAAALLVATVVWRRSLLLGVIVGVIGVALLRML